MAQHLASEGHQVTLGTRYKREVPSWLEGGRVFPIEWADDTSLDASCDKIDIVIQAAGMNAVDCATDPVSALNFNGLATSRLLLSAVKAGVGKFIYLSTAHVYANPLAGIITEKTCPTNKNPYATSHLVGEFAVQYAHENKMIEGIVLRLSNAFGFPVHMDANCWKPLINMLCLEAVSSGTITLKSYGEQERDFVALNDVARAVEHLINCEITDVDNGTYNVGSGFSCSVFYIAKTIQSRCLHLFGLNSEIIRPSASDGDREAKLNYRIEKLKNKGFIVQGNLVKEIDEILAACKIISAR